MPPWEEWGEGGGGRGAGAGAVVRIFFCGFVWLLFQCMWLFFRHLFLHPLDAERGGVGRLGGSGGGGRGVAPAGGPP